MKRHAAGLLALSFLGLPLLAACASTGSTGGGDDAIRAIIRVEHNVTTSGPVTIRLEHQFGGTDVLGDVDGGQTAEFIEQVPGAGGRYRLTAETPAGSERFDSNTFDLSGDAIVTWRLSSDVVRVRHLPEADSATAG